MLQSRTLSASLPAARGIRSAYFHTCRRVGLFTVATWTTAAADNWSGFYFGVNGGYASGSTSSGLIAGDPVSTALLGDGHGEAGHQNGALVGVQVGYNWIFNQRFLAGLEADLQHSALRSSSGSYIFKVANYSGRTQDTLDHFGTIRARLGWLATDNLLVFATGGYAFGKVTQTGAVDLIAAGTLGAFGQGYSFECTTSIPQLNCFSGASSKYSDGWTLGGGFEFAMSRNVKIKLEYLHLDLGRSSVDVTAANVVSPGDKPSFFTFTKDNAFDIFRAGINIQL